ncbi:MAG TPA: DUF5667 domain-containing protein [Nocardioidaceae bacterium]|nr:DUF5667 domain-containing protein [Nocardioidaceae bacterium]
MRSRLSRRDADVFAAALDGRAPEAADAARAERLHELVDVATLVRETCGRPTAQRDFVADLRSQLMAAAADELAGLDETPEPEADEARHGAPAQVRVRRRLTAAATAFVVVGGSFGIVAASAQSMPGEMLYPVKRATERVEIMLRSGSAEGRAMLDNATTRLDEVAALAAEGKPDADNLIADTLTDFTDEANDGGDLLLDSYQNNGSQADIAEVRKFTAASADRLESLAVSIPSAAASEYADAARAVTGLDSTAVNACPACGGQPPVDVNGDLLTAVAYVLDTANTDGIDPSAQASGRRHESISRHESDSSSQQPPAKGDLPVLPDDPITDLPTDSLPGTSGGGDSSGTNSGPKNDSSLTDELQDTTQDLTGGGSNQPKSGGKDTGVSGLLAPITQPVGELLGGVLNAP